MKVPNSAIIKEPKGENELAYVVRTRLNYEDKVLVKVLKTNERYSLVTNYTNEELKELGFTSEEIRKIPSISIYDEIYINK